MTRATLVFVVAMALMVDSTPMLGQDVVLLDVSDRVPVDPNANDESSSGLKLADLDGDGDLDIYVANGSSSLAGFPDQILINDGTGFFSDESAIRLDEFEHGRTPRVARLLRKILRRVDGDIRPEDWVVPDKAARLAGLIEIALRALGVG